MSIVELDEKQLVVFEDFERAIAGLAEQYLPLKIAGPDDKKGFDAVYAARQDVKKRRIKVEHMRKELKANALEFGRKVDGAAKKLEGLLTPIENHLEGQESEYNAAKEAIKRKEAEAKKAKLQARIDALQAVGAVVSLAVLEALTDEQFAGELATATKAFEERKAADAAKAQEEADRKAEAERLRKEQERIEAERKAEEARREAMKPDLQKLRDYAAALEAVPIPQVEDAGVYQVLLNATGEVERMCGRVETWCDEQEAGA